MKEFSKSYDLEERTARFAENLIDLLKKLPNSSVNKRMIEQCVSSVGSIGANYCEATEAESKIDFIHKISIAKKEIKETRYWIRLLAHANLDFKCYFKIFWKEADELLLIFAKIVRSGRGS